MTIKTAITDKNEIERINAIVNQNRKLIVNDKKTCFNHRLSCISADIDLSLFVTDKSQAKTAQQIARIAHTTAKRVEQHIAIDLTCTDKKSRIDLKANVITINKKNADKKYYINVKRLYAK
ncbi:MAG: hypothetical protein DRQ42_02140 [Gammaproteobacteria bacterium]|nr:MAG: hypothetical protein DRQ42_02140 [Gammaproteobacteria bacterium]